MLKFGEIEMKLENEIRSIFDECRAGMYADNGNYYVILRDHISGERYAITKETDFAADALGRPLEEGEVGIFNGERVRGITWREEQDYNADMLCANVDRCGNVELKDNVE